jgi:hypothetical protein
MYYYSFTPTTEGLFLLQTGGRMEMNLRYYTVAPSPFYAIMLVLIQIGVWYRFAQNHIFDPKLKHGTFYFQL